MAALPYPCVQVQRAGADGRGLIARRCAGAVIVQSVFGVRSAKYGGVGIFAAIAAPGRSVRLTV